METFALDPLREENTAQFKRDMQEAFQRGAEAYFGSGYGQVLPERDIDQSLEKANAEAYQAMVAGEMVGGAIVSVDPVTHRGDLEFLYVRHGTQGKGVGKDIWNAIERLHPDVEVWETVTPYFDRRNVYFYINSCGFHAVEFLRDLEEPLAEGLGSPDGDQGMLRFEKTAWERNRSDLR